MGADEDAEPAAGSAAGNRRTASRRTRTQAAAGTACRRPPRGLAHVSYDRIGGRPPGFRRLRVPPISRYTLYCTDESKTSTRLFARFKIRGNFISSQESPKVRESVETWTSRRRRDGTTTWGSGKLSNTEKRKTTRRARESVERVAACTEHKSPGRRMAVD